MKLGVPIPNPMLDPRFSEINMGKEVCVCVCVYSKYRNTPNFE